MINRMTEKRTLYPMKRWISLPVVLLMLLVMSLPAAAIPLDDLTALAQVAPEESAIFAALRTDAGYIETLDGLLAQAGDQTGLIPIGATLANVLDLAAQNVDRENDDASFETVFRSWLGDTVGFAAVMTDSNNPVPLLIFSVTDREAAADFVTTSNEELVETDLNGATLYVDPERSWEPQYLLTDTHLFLMDSRDAEAFATQLLTQETSLADNPTFQEARDALPLDDYNIFFYNDFLSLLDEQMMGEMAMGMGMLGLDSLFDMQALLDSMGAQAMGFTIQDGTSLVIDTAQRVEASEALTNLTIGGMNFEPLNPDFLASVPADSVAVAHATRFGPALVDSLNLLELVGEALDDEFESRVRGIDDEEVAVLLLDDLVTFMRLSFKGLTGQTVDEAFGWMTGDYATYLRVLDYGDAGYSADGGVILNNDDPAAAEAFVQGQRNALNDLYVSYDDSDNMIVVPYISDILRSALGDNNPFGQDLDLLLGWNDDLLAFGTRPGVTQIMSGDMASLADDDRYQAATAYFLPDAQSIAYLNLAPMSPLLTDLAEAASAPELNAVVSVLGLIESSSVSAVYNEDTSISSVRMVITLSTGE